MDEKVLIALIPLLPFLGFLFLGFFRKFLSEKWVSLVGCTGPVLAFGAAVTVFLKLHHTGATSIVSEIYNWIAIGNLNLKVAFYLDPLSSLLCLIVTGVGSLIHIYSIGYMHGDKGYGRYFSYLNLFTSMMLVLILGESLPLMFIGWEGVGLCSYLLIGFWYEDMEKSVAAQKAFVVNRVGDAAFLMGVFYCFYLFGSMSFQSINGQVAHVPGWQLALIGIFFFIGACGKSAQLPLYVWLPDAMAGPTPVSALIHAATMVTAGVYMIGRLSPLYSAAPYVGQIVAFVGVLTAFFAATIAITQRDIKKVLAYSTISQLGYMFMAMGLGAYTFGIFHLTTHAFFKAALFLGAGAVIHSYITKEHHHGVQDIYEMGGLWDRLPVAFITFIAAGFSLAALPPFSGFYSKDPILAYALNQSHGKLLSFPMVIWAMGLVTAFLTVAYTFRMIALVFFNKPRGEVVYTKNPHPSFPMSFVLIVLSILSIVGGFGLGSFMEHFLAPVWGKAGHIHISHKAHYVNLVISCSLSFIMAGTVFYLFTRKFAEIREYVNKNPFEWWVYFLSYQKYFVDEIYNMVIVKPLKKGSDLLLKWVDFFIIEGIVNGLPGLVRDLGGALRKVQNGKINQYATLMVAGTLCLLGYIGYSIFFWIK